MTCYLSSAFIISGLRLCVLKTLRDDTRKKEEKHQFQTPFLTKISAILKAQGCHDMLLIKGFYVI